MSVEKANEWKEHAIELKDFDPSNEFWGIRIENRLDEERLYYFDDFYLIENENASDTSQCWDGASPNRSNPSDPDSASSSLLLFIGLLLLFII